MAEPKSRAKGNKPKGANKGAKAPQPAEGGVATVDETDTDETDDTDGDDDDTDETPEAPVAIRWPDQYIETYVRKGYDEATVRARLKAYALGMDVELSDDAPELTAGWQQVVALTARIARDKALAALKEKLSAYTPPATLAALAVDAFNSAQVSLVVTADKDGKVTITPGGGGGVASTGGKRGPRGPRSGGFPPAPAGVVGGARGVLFDGQPLTAEMLRTDPRLAGSDNYNGRNMNGKLMPNGQTYSANGNHNAAQAVESWLRENGPLQQAARPLFTQGLKRSEA